MNDLLKPGYFDWIGPYMREMRPGIRYIELEMPDGLSIDLELLNGIFEEDCTISWMGNKRFVSGTVNSEELYTAIMHGYYQSTT